MSERERIISFSATRIDIRNTAAYSPAVFRIFFALVAVLCAAEGLAQTPAPPQIPPAVVYAVSDPAALHQFNENRATTRRMTDRLVIATTQQRDLTSAWKTLIRPDDRVGVKITTTGGRYFSSHHGILESVLNGIALAGVPRSRVIVWDRDSATLKSAGFFSRRGDFMLRAIDPPKGLDPGAKITAPVLGKLIWGDLMFRGKAERLRKSAELDDSLSADSYLASIVSRDVTKIINIAVLSDEPGCGVAGALYNITVPNVDNNRRFTQPQGASAILDVYTDPRVGPKVALHILDGLIGQYAAGPAFNPNYAFAHGTIYASRDPVALDATGYRLIEGWRKTSKLPPIKKLSAWLQEAEQAGIGTFAEEKIQVRAVTASQ